MPFETLKKSHLKRNIIIGVVVVAVIATLVIGLTRAKYRVAQSMPLINGTVNYSLADLNIVALYIDGVEATELDSSKTYTLDSSKSACTYKDGTTIDNLTLSYDSDTKTFTISPYTTKGTKCTLYFDEVKGQTIQDIIAGKTISTRSDFSTTLTIDTTGTVYSATDDDGTTYYFAGAPTDNWVSFAGFYWRTIRFNGDGTIRLIYNGTSTATTGTSTQLSSTSVLNSSSNNNMYVGYMYTSGEVHGLGTSSTIKGVLDTWYSNNLSSYASYIDTNAGFCGDRTPYSGSGTGITATYYGARYRLNTNKTPTFSCSDAANDLYTISSSSKGNKALTNPIGLITADEVAYAGGVNGTENSGYYLYTNQDYWTMSPSRFDGRFAYVFNVNSSGYLFDVNKVDVANGVRPVINLKADTLFEVGGAGTSTNPYVVV